MFPLFISFNHRNSRAANTIFSSNIFLHPRVSANGEHLLFGKFGMGVIASSVVSAITCSVSLILTTSSPIQMFGIAAQRIVAGAMSSFKMLAVFAREKNQSQTMSNISLTFVSYASVASVVDFERPGNTFIGILANGFSHPLQRRSWWCALTGKWVAVASHALIVLSAITCGIMGIVTARGRAYTGVSHNDSYLVGMVRGPSCEELGFRSNLA